MKKTIAILFCCVCVSAVFVFVYSAHDSQAVGNDLFARNFEALTRTEEGRNLICYTTISSAGPGNLTHQTWCTECGPVLCRTWSGTNGCRN